MKKSKLLILILAFALVLILAFTVIFSVCDCGGSSSNPGVSGPIDPPGSSGGTSEVEKPDYDEDGNRYVDLVSVSDDGFIAYNGLNKYIDEYDSLPTFEDEHSNTAFAFGGRDSRDVLGIVHAGGQYNFTAQPYLTEGANIIRNDIGSRVIKLFLGSDIADQYSFNENWGAYESLAELVQEDEIEDVFNMDFSTIVLVTYEMQRLQWNIRTSVSSSELARVEKEFYDLTKELITSYNGTGKTFVLQNWEGDNELKEALEKIADNSEHERTVINNYIAYNNARQAGISSARSELFATGNYAKITVYGALEINYISYAGATEKKLVDYVVPYSDADLFSFSDWSTVNSALAADLDYFLKQINKNANRQGANAATMNNIYLGEYGRKEHIVSEEEQFSYALTTAKIAVNKGVRFVCYWTLMCNERSDASNARPANKDMEGFWLIKPDGDFTKTFWFFKGLFENKNFFVGGEKPNVVLRLPEPDEDPIAFPNNSSDILFSDGFDDFDLDGNPDPSLNQKWESYSEGIRYDYVKAADRGLINRYFDKYGIEDEEGYTVVQKMPNNPNEEYIQYKVVRSADDVDGKLLIQGFLYDPTPRSLLRIAATKDGNNWDYLKPVYMTDKTGEYGYMYITVKIPVEYTSVRILFTNTKASNSWDPLVCRVLFVK